MIDYRSILRRYGIDAPCSVLEGDSGMNNTTAMLEAGGERYVLRIYNNHRDPEKVLVEHEVLELLQAESCPFLLPKPFYTEAGSSVAVLEDGSLAALFRYIEGVRPSVANPAHVASLGRLAGMLSRELARIRPLRKPLYDPYFLFHETYRAWDERALMQVAESSELLSERRQDFARLARESIKLEPQCQAIERLPRQWIHGDLVFGNTLCIGDRIMAALDFEFATVDARAMELAVTAADLLKPQITDLPGKMTLLARGFLETVKLEPAELELLPALMRLRLMDVALHFVVRLTEGLDPESVLTDILNGALFGLDWLEAHERQWLMELITEEE